MEAIRKFRMNLRRVKTTKYKDLENKDRVLKASMTLIKIAIYVGIAVVLLPLAIILIASITAFGHFTGAVNDASHKTTDWQGRTYYRRRW